MTALPFLRALTVIAACTGAAVHAASFDCAQAKTPAEHAICASPDLSALDEQVARDYQRALAALSPAGARQLRQSQRSWLSFVTRTCAARQRETPLASCMERGFSDRIAQLHGTGIRLGPWIINRVDRYEATPAEPDDASGWNSGVITTNLAYPQIDAPRTPAEAAWNAARAKDAGTIPAHPEEDEHTDYRIGCVGPRFVSLRVERSEYGHGAPHGTWSFEIRNTVRPDLREMRADDLFAPDSDWKVRLPDLFWQAYLASDRVDRNNPETEPGIRSAAIDPGHWLLTPDGLEIGFDAYEAGCYACNPGQLVVPWPTLKPLLAAPAVAACQAPPDPRR